jgi:F0F1-type ATP synthase membrane subunit b/b'
MVVVTNNWRIWGIGMVASLVLFLVIYFVAIKPSENTANQAIKTGLQQSQQALNQAGQQLKSATTGAASAATGATSATNSATKSAASSLSTAQKLTQCVTAAGTNTGAIEACQAKYQP